MHETVFLLGLLTLLCLTGTTALIIQALHTKPQ